MSDVMFHRGGFVEVYTEEGFLVLTYEEFQKARRRADSVNCNRIHKEMGEHHEGKQKD
jgi:hypothetical protein